MAKYDYKVEGADLTAQEEYVLDQVQAGKLADLKARFGEAEEERRLRARFLEELLAGGFAGFKVHRRGIGIAHGVVAEALVLQNAEIAHIVSLVDCLFQEEAKFRDARFQSHLVLNNSRFQKKADFHRAEVKLGLLCRGAIFQGEVNLSHTDIGGQFNAYEAQFQGQGTNNRANFNSTKVGKSVFFREAVFQGPVDFGSADIGGEFNAKGAQFQGQGPDDKANFNAIKVGQSAFFDNAVFQGPVDFGWADIDGPFSAKGAQFQGQGPDNKANFNAMKVGQSVFFDNAIFQGPVDFAGADIGRQFSADGAQFQGQGPDNRANFNRIKVGQGVFLWDAVFRGNVDFSSIKVEDITFFKGVIFNRGVSFNNAYFSYLFIDGIDIDKLGLEGTRVENELRIMRSDINELNGNNMQVLGLITIEDVTINNLLGFEDAIFKNLRIGNIKLPKEKDTVLLDGLTYSNIITYDWEKIFYLIDQSRFNAKNYYQLENYFQRERDQKRADKVFLKMKRREWAKISAVRLAE